MTALMPRRKECAVCENPIVVDGRIDRIYCSQSCNNLAWRLRSGKRWGGHFPALASGTKAGPREGRSALLRRVRGARAELLAIRKRVATLTDELAQRQRDTRANEQTIGDLADMVARFRADRVTEAACTKAELAAERERSQVALEAEQQRSQAALEAEQQRGQAALAAERERLGQRLQSAMMQSFADSLNLTLEREQTAIEAARMQAELAAVQERGQAALMAEQQRGQMALQAEQERGHQRLLSAMTEKFLQDLELKAKDAQLVEIQEDNVRLQVQCEQATARLRLAEGNRQPEIVELRSALDKKEAELAAVQQCGQAALLAEQQRGQTALQAEQDRGYQRLLSAMMGNFFQDVELKEKDAQLAEIQKDNVHLQAQCDEAMARPRLPEDRRQPETVELRLALGKKNMETDRLLSENGKLQRKLVAAEQANQSIQKHLSASEEQVQQERRRHLRAIRQVKQLEVGNNNLALLYQNREQQMLAQNQGRLAAELRQLQLQASAAPEYALVELNRLRIDLVTAQSENTQLRFELDRLTKSNTELEAEKSKLFFQVIRYEDRVSTLREKLKLRRAQDQKMLPAASDQDDTGEDQGSGWASALLGAAAGGAVGLLLGEPSQDKKLPAGSTESAKGLPDGRTRRKLLAP